ncbi:xyloglucanase [Rhizocola hellebori]|uniref:Xyloglucanase n=1 Tax=Rhizocola hellebori TaxID=1392758 RepID=A0A8J3QHE6_9ACTN|nr:cellulose-binding domain-containing protein [Rhizocola hellebori]GIH09667.1 xyloglucanase [Rhizocola hellebori]
MRKTLAGAIAAALTAGTLAVLSTQVASAAPSEPYNFRNARIDGGGFVSGIIFNPTEQNLIYARTDIGGAYRWNQSTSSWTPLMDWVGWNNWGWNGVLSMATDPVQTNRVYAATGMYLNSWDPNNGAIQRSTDKGATWTSTTLPFKVGGNFPGRGMGERLAVDPNNNANVYFGAEDGNGLWRSTNFGQTWAKVTNFPNVGNYVQDPADANGYLSHNQGVVWVSFDKAVSGAIYVGVADLQNTVYRSLNNGTSWERIAGQPTGFMAHQGQISNGVLYITTSDKGGPYDGGHGDVWKYQISTGAWTQISPVPSSDTNNNYFGYAGLSVVGNTIMVTGYSSWYPDTFIWRSTDGGTTWRSFYDYAWPNRTNKYTLNISSVPWLTFADQKSLPEQTPKLGWMTEALEIDPFNPNRMMFGTGATLFGTTNLTALDTGGTVTLSPMVKGLEETAILDLVSPPSGGANLFSGMLDLGGFRHTNLDAVPPLMYNQPYHGAVTSIDYAEANPMWMVRVGRTDRTGATTLGLSTDGGANWFQANVPAAAAGGTVALSPNNQRIVWSTESTGVWFATSFGGSFAQASGLPATAKVESDRVNSNKFYGYYNGTFYVSTNGGQSFTATAASGLPTDGRFKPMLGIEGDIWVSGSTGLYHSTNSGTSFTKISTVTSGRNIGFGRAAPNSNYMALYMTGVIDGVDGLYRSNNAGGSWVRINDNQHQYGNAGEALTGDPRVYGRVYLGTNGRGIIVGDSTTTPPTGSPSPSPSNSASPSPSPSPSVSPSPSPSPSVSPSPGGPRSCSATYTILNQWPGGYGAEVRVTNTGTTAITGWRLNWTFGAGQVIGERWSATVTQTGSAVVATNVSYNGNLAPNASTAWGFNGSWNGTSNPIPAITCTPL